jgi:hypothetical protein
MISFLGDFCDYKIYLQMPWRLVAGQKSKHKRWKELRRSGKTKRKLK